MSTALRQSQSHGHDSHYTQGWALSIVLHGTAIGVTIALLSDLHLAAQPDAFRWQVSVVGTANPSSIQEPTATPMEPPTAPPTPVTPSLNESASVAAPALPARMAARQRQPVEKQAQSAPQAIHSQHLAPPVTAPTDPSPSVPSETAMPAPSSSPSARGTAHMSSSELPPPAASSPPVEEAAASPSREASMVARVPLDAPPDVTPARHPEASFSPRPLPDHSPPVQEARMSKPDFGWLTDSLRSTVEQSQKYSTVARLNGLEGRVVLRITVKDNGELLVAIATSSGHALLDQDAVEQVMRLSPLPLLQPLGRAQQVLKLPIIYSLHQ